VHELATESQQPAHTAILGNPRPLRAIAPWAATVATVVILGTLFLMLADTGHISAGQTLITPTPTATPTPTPSPTPSATPLPSPMAGYKLYPDFHNEFYIEYPEQWTATPQSSGVELADDPKSPAYDVQVLIPSTWSGPDQTQSGDDAAAWVNYVLTDFYGGERLPGSFTRTPGSQPPATFGGATWQTGGGVFTTGQMRYRVQVYATIRDSKPYVINLAASDDQFDHGRDQYFLPILRTFTFLTPGQ
jgi:hypothetical protein